MILLDIAPGLWPHVAVYSLVVFWVLFVIALFGYILWDSKQPNWYLFPRREITVYVVEVPATRPAPSKPANVTQQAWDAHRLYGAPL